MFFTKYIVVIVAVANVDICTILSRDWLIPWPNLSRNGVFSSKGTKTSQPGYTFGFLKKLIFFAFPLGYITNGLPDVVDNLPPDNLTYFLAE